MNPELAQAKGPNPRRHKYQSRILFVVRDENIVRHRPIARQRLGKHIPAGDNARNNRTFIATQRISKHASLTTETVFCVVRTK
jgi:hypothetical protein